MKKTYITLEEVLALRGTDTKIYTEYNLGYCMFVGGVLCSYTKDGILDAIGAIMSDNYKHYILEPEVFKIKKVGLYKTRDGSTAFVSCIDEYQILGMILGDDYVTKWDLDGTFCGNKDLDLIEYIGD